MTNDILRRIFEHKLKVNKGFTARYSVDKLIYFEILETAESAIAREKQIKAGSRAKKLALVNAKNPGWKDLTDELSF